MHGLLQGAGTRLLAALLMALAVVLGGSGRPLSAAPVGGAAAPLAKQVKPEPKGDERLIEQLLAAGRGRTMLDANRLPES
jgi:hypothetical protein